MLGDAHRRRSPTLIAPRQARSPVPGGCLVGPILPDAQAPPARAVAPPLLGPRLLRCRGWAQPSSSPSTCRRRTRLFQYGRATARRAARQLGRLAHRREVASDARGVLDHREQPHASLAGGTGEDVHAKLRASSSAQGRYPPVGPGRSPVGPGRSPVGPGRSGSAVAAAGSSVGGFGAIRGSTGSRPRARPRSGRCGSAFGGTLVARRHSSDSGSMSTATVPSVYAFFRVMRTRPSGRCWKRSCAMGGRNTQRGSGLSYTSACGSSGARPLTHCGPAGGG